MQSELHFEWGWNNHEYRRLHRAVTWHGSQRWVVIVALAISFIVAMYFGSQSAVAFLRGDPVTAISSLPWVLVGVSWALLLTRLQPFLAARRCEKLYTGAYSLALTETSLRASTAVGNSELNWSAFKKAVETREFFLLYFSPNMAYYLPKRSIQHASDAEGVRALLRQKLGQKALLDHASHAYS